MPQANSTTSIPRVTEPRASSRVLPCSHDTMRAISSRWSRSSIWNRNRTRARAGGAVAAHPGKAARAAATAASTSLSEARGPAPAPRRWKGRIRRRSGSRLAQPARRPRNGRWWRSWNSPAFSVDSRTISHRVPRVDVRAPNRVEFVLITHNPQPGPVGLVFLGSRASVPADGARSAAFASLPRAGSPRSHGTTTLGSYLPQATRAGPRREFQSPIRGRGLRRATSVQTPIAVRTKLPAGRHAPLRGRPLCPRQTPCTRFRERMQPRVVPCASARRRRRGGNSQEGGPRPWEAAGPG